MNEKQAKIFATSFLKNFVIGSSDIKKLYFRLIETIDICKLYTAVQLQELSFGLVETFLDT